MRRVLLAAAILATILGADPNAGLRAAAYRLGVQSVSIPMEMIR